MFRYLNNSQIPFIRVSFDIEFSGYNRFQIKHIPVTNMPFIGSGMNSDPLRTEPFGISCSERSATKRRKASRTGMGLVPSRSEISRTVMVCPGTSCPICSILRRAS